MDSGRIFGQGMTNNVQDDFIYFNNLGGARYKRGAAPTNAQLMALHNAQRHGDPGWGAYANRGGVGVLKFADVIRGQDAQGNETSMVHFSENLLSSPITVSGTQLAATRTIDLTGATAVIVGVRGNQPIPNREESFSANYEFSFIPVALLGTGINAFRIDNDWADVAFSFPNKTLTSEATIRADFLGSVDSISFVGKITG